MKVQDEHVRLRLSYQDKSLRSAVRAVILDAIAIYGIVAVLGCSNSLIGFAKAQRSPAQA
jgi:hypothetical protein